VSDGAPTLAALDQAIRAIADDPITRRLARPPDRRDEESLWLELSACILGSAVSHDHTRDAMVRLGGSPILQPGLPAEPERLVDEICVALSRPLAIDGRTIARYPYPKVRADLLVRAATQIYAADGSLVDLLQGSGSSRDARRSLVRIPGVGPKQASLFLRNVGHAEDLAVLDRHILRYMAWCGLAEPTQRVASLRQYETLEASVAVQARRLGIAVAVWDLAAWIVVRSISGRIA